MGGGAAVPHFLTDLGGPAASPRSFLACHGLLQIQFLLENELTWRDQISNHSGRNWRFPGLSTISAITLEIQKCLDESDRSRTPPSTQVGCVVGRSAAAFVARTASIRARRRRSPGTGFRNLARSFLSVLAAGGGGHRRPGNEINLWACQRGQWDEVLSAPRGVNA